MSFSKQKRSPARSPTTGLFIKGSSTQTTTKRKPPISPIAYETPSELECNKSPRPHLVAARAVLGRIDPLYMHKYSRQSQKVLTKLDAAIACRSRVSNKKLQKGEYKTICDAYSLILRIRATPTNATATTSRKDQQKDNSRREFTINVNRTVG
jgi:hypothetical protein